MPIDFGELILKGRDITLRPLARDDAAQKDPDGEENHEMGRVAERRQRDFHGGL